MLLSLPLELVLKVAALLPQRDICNLAATSRNLNCVVTPLLDTAVALFYNPLDFDAFVTYMCSGLPNRHPERLRHLTANTGPPPNAGGSIASLLRLLELTVNLTSFTLIFPYFRYVTISPLKDALQRLPHLHTITLDAFRSSDPDLGHCVPDRIQTLTLQGTGMHGPRYVVALFPRLTSLHTLTLDKCSFLQPEFNPELDPAPVPSVRHLTVITQRVSLAVLFRIFPHLEVLRLEDVRIDAVELPPSAAIPVVHLPHLQLLPIVTVPANVELHARRTRLPLPPLFTGKYPADVALHARRVDLVFEPPGKIIHDMAPKDAPQRTKQFSTFCRTESVRALSTQTDTLGPQFWELLAAHTPGLRWLSVEHLRVPWRLHLTGEETVAHILAGTAQLLQPTALPLTLLHVVVPSAIPLDGATGLPQFGCTADEEKDETLRGALAEVLPRHIPVLRYLLLSRGHGDRRAAHEKTFERMWVCLHVTADRGLVEIPVWEGERMLADLREALQPE